ncbi:MAG TPA: tetratricopeptide repeat protein [Candidatus Hypogeohydataceae bacterium YC41]
MNKKLLYGGLFFVYLLLLPSGCKKGDADKVKEELKLERKKREETSEKYKEVLKSLAEEQKRAESLERILMELGERLKKQGKLLPEEASKLNKLKTKREKEESQEQEKAVEKLLDLGNQFYSKGDYAAAKEVYSSGLELGAKGPAVYMGLGKCCIEAKEYDRAISLLENAATQLEEKGENDRLCPLYNNLGWLYTMKGEFKEAEKVYLKAIKLNPNYANAYYNLGLLYDLHLKDEMGAIECFEKYIELKGERSDSVQKRLAEIKQR